MAKMNKRGPRIEPLEDAGDREPLADKVTGFPG